MLPILILRLVELFGGEIGIILDRLFMMVLSLSGFLMVLLYIILNLK